MKRTKINRCEECKEPLKHIGSNKWMCDQSPTQCVSSAKVTFINEEEE